MIHDPYCLFAMTQVWNFTLRASMGKSINLLETIQGLSLDRSNYPIIEPITKQSNQIVHGIIEPIQTITLVRTKKN